MLRLHHLMLMATRVAELVNDALRPSIGRLLANPALNIEVS